MQKPQIAITPRMDTILTYKGREGTLIPALQVAKWVCDFSTQSVQSVSTPEVNVVYGPGDLPVKGEVRIESGFDRPIAPLRHETNANGDYLYVLSRDAIVRRIIDPDQSEMLRLCKQ
jgi:hypothetical protein